MDRRLKLHEILSNIEGVKKAYFQPPVNVQIVYPCIIYQWNNTRDLRADNYLYLSRRRYTVTVIDRNPDSTIPEKVAHLPMTAFANAFTKDGLHHTIYNTYF